MRGSKQIFYHSNKFLFKRKLLNKKGQSDQDVKGRVGSGFIVKY